MYTFDMVILFIKIWSKQIRILTDFRRFTVRPDHNFCPCYLRVIQVYANVHHWLQVAKCSDCKIYFKMLPNEQKLEEEDLRKIIDDKKNSSNLYPDLTEEIKFRCQSCKGRYMIVKHVTPYFLHWKVKRLKLYSICQCRRNVCKQF